MSVLGCGDILCCHAAPLTLHQLNSVYHYASPLMKVIVHIIVLYIKRLMDPPSVKKKYSSYVIHLQSSAFETAKLLHISSLI